MKLHVRLLSVAGSIVAALVLMTGCGTVTSPTNASDEASPTPSSPSSHPSSASPTPSPSEPTSTPRAAEFPPDFVETMEQSGYVLENAEGHEPFVSSDEAISNARDFYRLFTAEDPVAADYFLVTTPTGGPLEDPNDPESGITKPRLDKTPMWVIYARAEMLKDERNPDRGTVTGTVVTFVFGDTGKPESAVTY